MSKVVFEVGDLVDYHSVIGGPVTSTGHIVEDVGTLGNRPVAWLKGKSGCVAMDALTTAEAALREGEGK